MKQGKKFYLECSCGMEHMRFVFNPEVEWKREDGSTYVSEGYMSVSMEPNYCTFFTRIKRAWTYIFNPYRFFDGGDVLLETNSEDDIENIKGLIDCLTEFLASSKKNPV